MKSKYDKKMSSKRLCKCVSFIDFFIKKNDKSPTNYIMGFECSKCKKASSKYLCSEKFAANFRFGDELKNGQYRIFKS